MRPAGWRRLARFALLAAGLLAVVAILGPRMPVDTTLRPVQFPADLDAYLADAEARVSALRPGAERRIVWHTADRESRTPYAVVYLHGFSASRQETAPLAERVADALGANLYYARLRGHGCDGPAMGRATANDWLNDAAEAYALGERLGERVVVMGTSTGATLALWLATQPGRDRLYTLVLVSPNLGAADPRERCLLLPWVGKALALLMPTRSFEPTNAAQARHWTTEYPSVALLQLAALVNHVRRLPLEAIAVPSLTFYSPRDQVIDVPRMLATHARIGRTKRAVKELVAVTDSDDPAQHVLAGDILSPSTTGLLAARSAEFVRRVRAHAEPPDRPSASRPVAR